MKPFLTLLLLISWLNVSAQIPDRNITQIQSIDYFQLDYLNFLDSVLQNKQIVFLGEADHGDGTSIKLKSAITKYLVSNLNYEVLLFERGFIHMSWLDSLLNTNDFDNDLLLIEGFKQGDIINEDKKELFEFIKFIKSKNSIIVGGIDIISNFSLMEKLLIYELYKRGVNKKNLTVIFDQLIDLNYLQDCHYCKTTEFPHLDNLKSKLEDILKREHESSILHQRIKNLIYLTNWIKNRPDRENEAAYHELRDFGMAENIKFYLNKYPKKKFIINTSTYHITRNVIDFLKAPDYLSDSIIEKSYFLPIIGLDGSRGYYLDENNNTVENIDAPSFLNSKYSFGFVDFSSLSEKDKDSINEMKIEFSGIFPLEADWSSVYDGFFFIQTMEPTRWRYLKPHEINNLQKLYDTFKLNKLIK